MRLIYAGRLGFCDGVKRVMERLKEAKRYADAIGKPLSLYGEPVHNRFIKEEILASGISIFDSAEEAPVGDVVLVRSHGISKKNMAMLEKRASKVFDATCPVVLHSHEVLKKAENRRAIIGVKEHPEVEEIRDSFPDAVLIENASSLSLLDRTCKYQAVLQTTYSKEALSEILLESRKIGLDLELLNLLCPSVEERKKAIDEFVGTVDAIVVVSDDSSSNGHELYAYAKSIFPAIYFTDDIHKVLSEIRHYETVGVTASSSTPSSRYTL